MTSCNIGVNMVIELIEMYKVRRDSLQFAGMATGNFRSAQDMGNIFQPGLSVEMSSEIIE